MTLRRHGHLSETPRHQLRQWIGRLQCCQQLPSQLLMSRQRLPRRAAQPQALAEPALPQRWLPREKKYRLPSGQKMPAADLYKRADQRAAVTREPVEAKGQEEIGAEAKSCGTSSSSTSCSCRRPPPVPQPPEGEGEVLPDRELNLDGLVPPPLMKLHQRLSKEVRVCKASHEALSHELQHSSDAEAAEQASCTCLKVSTVFMMVCSQDCEICQKTKASSTKIPLLGSESRRTSAIWCLWTIVRSST